MPTEHEGGGGHPGKPPPGVHVPPPDWVGTLVLGWITLAAVACVGLPLAFMWSQDTRCAARWHGLYKTQWSLGGGCQVNADGRWVPDTYVTMRVQ